MSLLIKHAVLNLCNDFKGARTDRCLMLVKRTCWNGEKEKVVKKVVEEEEDFRVLQIKPKPLVHREFVPRKIHATLPPRTEIMPIDQDWTNVWPGPRSFHPATVPLPVRQGLLKDQPPLSKYGNLELMKIPNFLHLTPAAIKKHCEAIKQFCTPWPAELETDEILEKLYPLEVVSSDYCHSSPTIRDPMSRIMSIKVKLSDLELDEHAKDKFLRLIGPRYDPKTDIVTITTDNCPLKKQNYDYALYLLTVAYCESWNVEDWESQKTDEDMEKYIWSKRQTKRNFDAFFEYTKKPPVDSTSLAESVEKLINEKEDRETIKKYGESVLEMHGLPKFESAVN